MSDFGPLVVPSGGCGGEVQRPAPSGATARRMGLTAWGDARKSRLGSRA